MAEGARIPTPLVLVAASAMLAIAFVIAASVWWEGSDAPAAGGAAPEVEDRTPELAAQSFYDAWRRRRWDQALAVSVGQAHRAVQEKRARDEELPEDERIVAERMWDALARAPLQLQLDEAEMLGGDRTMLHGTAEYEFVNRPYRRRVSFLVEPRGRHYRVARMDLGEVLTPLPTIFAGANEEERP
jgi:hypothetical protein